jgi:hypothetical protein
LILIATALFLPALRGQESSGRLLISALLLGLALTMRLQSLIPLLVSFLVLFAIWTYKKGFSKIRQKVISGFTVFLVALVTAFGLLHILESGSVNQYIIERNKRATLYTGLLETYCGKFNRKAIEATLQDLEKPFPEAVKKRLTEVDNDELLRRVLCKVNLWFELHSFSYDQLRVSFQNDATPEIRPDRAKALALMEEIEGIAGMTILGWLYLFVFSSIKKDPNSTQVLAGIFIYSMYLGLHLLLEIQGRYLLTPVLVLLLLTVQSRIHKQNWLGES